MLATLPLAEENAYSSCAYSKHRLELGPCSQRWGTFLCPPKEQKCYDLISFSLSYPPENCSPVLSKLMGSAETRHHSSGRSASHSNSGAKQASSMFSPVHRRGVTGSAPSTPSGIVVTGGPKRLQKVAEDDDNGRLTELLQSSAKFVVVLPSSYAICCPSPLHSFPDRTNMTT